MRITIALALILISAAFLSSKSQVSVPESREGWKSKVDSAMTLIYKYDTANYWMVIRNCKEIEFILGDFSTTKPPNTVALCTKDMNLSVNNVASALVHESYHLEIYNRKEVLSPREEEEKCYVREYDFLCKLPFVEDWLFMHVMQQVVNFSK